MKLTCSRIIKKLLKPLLGKEIKLKIYETKQNYGPIQRAKKLPFSSCSGYLAMVEYTENN